MRREASISGRLKIDRSQFTKDLAAAKTEADKFSAAMKHFARPNLDGMKDLERQMQRINTAGKGGFFGGGGTGSKWTEFNSKATAARNVVEEVYNAVNKPAQANAWYQDMLDGLAAVMGSADQARAHMGNLRLISDEQSMSDEDFEKMVQYSIRLQSLGHSAEFTADFLRELGNSAEYMGGTVGDMGGFVAALDKIDQSGKDSLKTILALTKETPAFRKVLEAAFGTSSAAELDKMNMSAQELTEGILRGMKQIETARPSATEEGLSVALRKKQTMGADAADNNGTLGDRTPLTGEEAAAAREKLRADLALRDASAALKKSADAAKKTAEKQDAAEKKKQALADAEAEKAEKARNEITGALKIASLRSMGRNKEADALEREKRIASLMTGSGFTADQAAGIVAQEDANASRSANPGRIRSIGKSSGDMDAGGFHRSQLRSQTKAATYTGLGSQYNNSALDAWSTYTDNNLLNGTQSYRNPMDAPRHQPRTDAANKRASEAARVRNEPGGNLGTILTTGFQKLEQTMKSVEDAVRNSQPTLSKIR